MSTLPKKKNGWRKPRRGKGVVYLSHLPHGFYEEELKKYFRQFGKISAVSVPRSKTGKAKGYAFVEFTHPKVAEIAADTMNNYLMCKRLMKAKYIPPAEQKPRYFLAAEAARTNHKTVPEKAKLRVENNRKVKNRRLKISLEAEMAFRLIKKRKMLKSKIENLGLDYDFEVEEGDIESIIEKKKQQEMKKESMQDTLSNEESSLENDEESHSSEENKLPEINKPITAIKGKSQKNKVKQQKGKATLNSSQDSPTVQEKQNKTKAKSPKQNKLMKLGQKQNKVLTTIEKKSKNHKNPTTPVKETSPTKSLKAEAVVMEVDENDEEISFKTPPNVLKKSLKSKSSGSKITPKNKSNLKLTPRKRIKNSFNISSGEQD